MAYKIREQETGNILAECNSYKIASRELKIQLEADIIQGKTSDINSYQIINTEVEKIYTIDDVTNALHSIEENIQMDDIERQAFSYYVDIIENAFHYLTFKMKESEHQRLGI